VSHLTALRAMLRSPNVCAALWNGSVTPYEGQRGIGTRARTCGSGFRRDGSYQYTPSIIATNPFPPYEDRESPPVIERIRRCTHQFSTPAVVDQNSALQIAEALLSLRVAGVEVYAFLPPFSSEAYGALEQSSELRGWWHYYTRCFPSLMESQGIVVVPARRPCDIGLDDTYMVDGFHPSEVYMAHVIRELVKNAPSGSLLKQVDLGVLSSRIQRAYSPLAFDKPRLRSKPAAAVAATVGLQ